MKSNSYESPCPCTTRLRVQQPLLSTVNSIVQSGGHVSVQQFWTSFEKLLERFSLTNRVLLQKRSFLQKLIDDWLVSHRPFEQDAYVSFLTTIGYLEPPPPEVPSCATPFCPELETAAPQLVVPADNARYLVKALNSRWGSLLDCLVGTDICKGDVTDAFKRINRFLDVAIPLEGVSYSSVRSLSICDGQLRAQTKTGMVARLKNPAQLQGWTDEDNKHALVVVLVNNGMRIRVCVDNGHEVGSMHPWALSDLILESAVTLIVDLEDAVATVNASEKATVYRNWHEIQKGTLRCRFEKEGRVVDRGLGQPFDFRAPDGARMQLPPLALPILRHVGIHMYTDSVLYSGQPVPEGLLDAMVGTVAALKAENLPSSVYFVKPKLQGSQEVDMMCDVLRDIERLLSIPPLTLKLGVMDEERRTSLNLASCLAKARDRCFFINTGFLDRTGSEIRDSFFMGAHAAQE